MLYINSVNNLFLLHKTFKIMFFKYKFLKLKLYRSKYFLKFFKILKNFSNFIFNCYFLKKQIIYSFLKLKKKNSIFRKKNYFFQKTYFKLWKILKKKKIRQQSKIKINRTISKSFFKFYLFKSFVFSNKKFFYKRNSKMFDFSKKFFYFLKINFSLLKDFLKFTGFNYKIIFFLKRLKKMQLAKIFLFFEFLLWFICLKVFRHFTITDIFFFIKNQFFFLNGVAISNPNTFLKINSLVQLKCCKNTLLLLKFYLKLLKKKIFKIKFFFWKNFKNKSNKVKYQNNHVAKWVFPFFWLKKKMPSYLEFDYLTFSFFILYLPSVQLIYTSTLTKNINFYLFYLYNWRKIN